MAAATDYRRLTSEEALAVIGSDGQWVWDVPKSAKSIFYLFARDKNYWGRYFGMKAAETERP